MNMRRTIVIIFAVAVLGGLSFYVNKGKASNTAQEGNADTSQVATSTTSGSTGSGTYRNGTFSGAAAETPYGTVQVAAIIDGGKIIDIKFLQMPDDEHRSEEITAMSEPQLKQNAITAQNSDIDFVSGATSTSYGYQESLQAALDKARQS